jgi:hypothetical protein
MQLHFNDRVKWKKPLDEDEKAEIMTVIEDRGDRVLVVSDYAKDMAIPPTSVYRKSDLAKVKK